MESGLNTQSPIAVCSRSFSQNQALKAALLERFVNVKFNDAGVSLQGKKLVEFLKGAEGAIVGLEAIDDAILGDVPGLKVIGKYGVGTDKLDFAAFRKHGVKLGWTPGVNKRSVAELTLAFFILMLRRMPFANRAAVKGPWHQVVGQDLSGKTVGIIGLGHVGKDLVSLLEPFGCRILAHDIVDLSAFASEHGIEPTSLENLLRRSDLVTVHTPLDSSTRDLIGERELSWMKPTGFLVNAARGGIVNEMALYSALTRKLIAGAAFDVLTVEPPVVQPLLDLEDFFLTPHIGGSSKEAILAMGLAAIDGLARAEVPE